MCYERMKVRVMIIVQTILYKRYQLYGVCICNVQIDKPSNLCCPHKLPIQKNRHTETKESLKRINRCLRQYIHRPLPAYFGAYKRGKSNPR